VEFWLIIHHQAKLPLQEVLAINSWRNLHLVGDVEFWHHISPIVDTRAELQLQETSSNQSKNLLLVPVEFVVHLTTETS
jgi:hypothetical protein